MKKRINFPWATQSLTRVFKIVGFKWKKSLSKRKVLIEILEIVMRCHKHLVQTKSFRESGKKLFFYES